MTRTNSYAALAAAVLSVGVWGAGAWAQQNTSTDTRTNTTYQRTDTTAGDKDLKVEKGSDTGTWNVRRELSGLTQDALDKDGFDNLVGLFNDADRDRIKKEGDVNKDQPDLQAKIGEINAAWKAKYGHDFKVRDNKDVFADATVKFGEIGNTPALASDVKKNSEQANPNEVNKTAGGNENIEKGRDIAVVTLPAVQDAPELTVPMIHEVPMAWKVNVPDTLTYQKLHDNLMKHLSMIADKKDSWPADEKTAEQQVVRHVLMAVLDVEPNGAQAASETQQPAAGSTLNPALNQPLNSNSSTDINKPAK